MNRYLVRAAFLGAAALCLAAMATSPAGASVTPGWRISNIDRTVMSGFSAVAAISRTDVWAVGSVVPEGSPVGYQPVVRRWNGHSWLTMRMPRRYAHALLFAVAGSSPRNVWVFGQYRDSHGNPNNFALRWNGTWSLLRDWRTYNVIYNAVVLSSSDVWVFGTVGTWHYNGHRWTSFKLPYSLVQGSAISADNIWAVGTDNGSLALVLAHWDGHRWATHPLPVIKSAPSGAALYAVLAEPRQVWVVGSAQTTTSSVAIALRLQVGRWRQYTVSGQTGFGTIVPDGSGGLWAGQLGPHDATSAVHFSGGRWHAVVFPHPGGKFTSTPNLAWVPGTHTVFAAGLAGWGGLPATEGLILGYRV